VGAGLAYGIWLYARSVCDIKSAAAAAVCDLWRYISDICLCLIVEWLAELHLTVCHRLMLMKFEILVHNLVYTG